MNQQIQKEEAHQKAQILHNLSDHPAYMTRNYAMFFAAKANRPYDSERVNDLVKAIQQDNRLADYPIVINSQMEVMDGQHRLGAAKILGVAIYYILDPTMEIRHAARINNNTKNWRMADYLNFEVMSENPHYIILKKFHQENPWMPLNQAAVLCSTQSHQHDFHRRFGEGAFEVDRLEFAHRIASMLLDFKPYCTFYGQKSFIATIRGLAQDPNYNHKRMVRKLKSKQTEMVSRHDTDGYYEMLNKIYNYREPKERWVKFWRSKPVNREVMTLPKAANATEDD